jgi:hypothetical protein
MTIETFPQHERERKPSVDELLDRTSEMQLPGEALIALWRRHYPELSVEDVTRLYEERGERLQREADHDRREMHFMREAYREATGSELPGDMPMAEIWKIIAQHGSPLARARAKSAQAFFNSPETRAFYRDLEAAARLDPYWEVVEEGHYKVLPGARHETGEALVEAYRAARALKNRMAADFAQLMNGIDPAGEGAADKAHAAMRKLLQRYPEASEGDFDREALIRAWLAAIADAVWNEPAQLTEFRVGGARLPKFVNLPDGRKVALRWATLGQWIEGPGREGDQIGRILLERAGGDLAAKIIDHLDGQ